MSGFVVVVVVVVYAVVYLLAREYNEVKRVYVLIRERGSLGAREREKRRERERS